MSVWQEKRAKSRQGPVILQGGEYPPQMRAPPELTQWRGQGEEVDSFMVWNHHSSVSVVDSSWASSQVPVMVA